MPPSHFVLLYVRDPLASAAFYERLLGAPAVEASPTFAMFALSGGLMLGLWGRDGVQPPVQAAPGASELAFVQPDDAAVHATHARWLAAGATPAQDPVVMDFGCTCTVTDPDGHRLRAFAPGA